MSRRSMEIKVNSTEANKDLGFEILASSGLSVICLENDSYVVPEEAVSLLRNRGVMYELISVNGEKI